jgi:WD40 repeat protein
MLVMQHHNRGLFAGFADGIVRHYDDRSNTGNMAQLSIIRVSPGSQEPVFAVGVFASDENTLYTCSAKAIRIFDVRQTSKPKKVVELPGTRIGSAPAQSPLSPSASFSLGGSSSLSFGAFRVGVYTNLCCVIGAEGQADILNHKGDSVIPKTITKLPVGFLPPGNFSATGLSHSMKPLFFTGNDLLLVK